MDNILPTSFSETATAPIRNGHSIVLVGAGSRAAYQAWSASVLTGPAWHSADTIAYQSSVLEAERDPELDADQGTDSLLPGFETLTWADLDQAVGGHRDVTWCVQQGSPLRSDGLDPDPDQASHCGMG